MQCTVLEPRIAASKSCRSTRYRCSLPEASTQLSVLLLSVLLGDVCVCVRVFVYVDL